MQMKELSHQIKRSPEIKPIEPQMLLASMGDVLQSGKVSERELEHYLKTSCRTLKIGTTDVIIANEEHRENARLHPALEAIAGAKGTKAILVEYFSPELQRNAANFPIFGKILEKRSKKLKNMQFKTGVSNQLAEIAKENDKPIAVADIANGPQYYYGYSLVPLTVFEASMSYYPLLATVTIPYIINRVQEYSSAGHFDPKKIHGYEKILLDTEDARRIFTAEGIEQLASEYPGSRILSAYPKGHAMRISNYLTNTEPTTRATKAVKKQLYRFIPGVDKSVRTYRWKDQLSRLGENDNQMESNEEKVIYESLAGWRKISDRRL